MMMMMMHSCNKKNTTARVLRSSLICACLVGTVTGFFGGQKAKSVAAPKSSPRTQEAVDLWDATYPFNRQPIQQDDSVLDKIGNFGVPQMDLDGTKVFKAAAGQKKRRLTDVTEQDVATNFNALATVYGDDRALDMVTIFPICLSFNSNEFQPTYAAFSDIFGPDEALGMVSRNPGLLAVKADDATGSNAQTMAFSYIVAITRPIGKLGPVLIGGLLTIPGIENVAGLEPGTIRENFFHTISFGLI